MADIANTVFNFNMSTDAVPVTRQGFSLPMTMVQGLAAGFTERFRVYFSAAEGLGDADLNAAAQARLSASFAAGVSRSAIGRWEADVAQVVTFTLVGSDDGTYSITINGIQYDFVAAANTTAQIVDGLAPIVTADLTVSAVSDGVDQITVTSLVAGTPFSFLSAAPGASVWTEITATANVSIETELALVLEENATWFHFGIDSRLDAQILRAANWAESNGRLFWAQSDSADVRTTATSDVASTLMGLSRVWTAYNSHDADAQFEDTVASSVFASNDFDVTAPQAQLQTLPGITTQKVSGTVLSILRAKNANFYDSFQGLPSYWPGVVASGLSVELVTTLAWTEARIQEALAQMFKNTVTAGQRVPFNDDGFARIGRVIETILLDGERIGHFNLGTTALTWLSRAEVPDADVLVGKFRPSFGAQYTNKVECIDLTGIISVGFQGF